MASKLFLDQYACDERFRVRAADDVATPALAIYCDEVEHNISVTVQALGGDASRWRPHVKTAKLGYVMRLMTAAGVTNFKCATTLELRVALDAGAEDVLLAYPLVGPAVERVRAIAAEYRDRRISALVETREQAERWRGSRVGVFIDVNPGMDRTGIEQQRHGDVVELARAIAAIGLEFRGVHYYDGHWGGLEMPERCVAAHRGYDELMLLLAALAKDVHVEEVTTAGTPAFPCSLSYEPFRSAHFIHRVSPGTVIYNDASSLAHIRDFNYRPAALVLSRVVSHPRAGVITCDAGHKTVSADAGIPTCLVLGHPELEPLSPSEEHLPMRVKNGAQPPAIGEMLYLMPRHICPTVNNFDDALIVSNGEIEGIERVSARGREAPLVAHTVAN